MQKDRNMKWIHKVAISLEEYPEIEDEPSSHREDSKYMNPEKNSSRFPPAAPQIRHGAYRENFVSWENDPDVVDKTDQTVKFIQSLLSLWFSSWRKGKL